MINLHIKFEIPVFIHYEDMKGNAKHRNWDRLGIRAPKVTGILPFDRAHIHFNGNYVSILYCFRVIVSYFSLPFEFHGDLSYKKTRVPGLSYNIAFVILHLAILIQ